MLLQLVNQDLGYDRGPVLRDISISIHAGDRIALVGESGAGQTAKAANQIVVAGTMVAMCEALVLAQKSGVDPQRVVDACRADLDPVRCVPEGVFQRQACGYVPDGQDHDVRRFSRIRVAFPFRPRR